MFAIKSVQGHTGITHPFTNAKNLIQRVG